MDILYRVNHIKVQDWITRMCKIICTEFTKKWEDFEGVPWQNNEENGDKLKAIMKQKKVCIKHFEGEKIASGNINDFDLNLMVAAIQSVILSNSKLSEEEKSTEIRHLKSLVPVRNEISHSPTYQISKERLDEIWAIFDAVFKFNGVSDVDLKILKRSEQALQYHQLQMENIDLENTEKARNLIHDALVAVQTDPKIAINKCCEGLLLADLSKKDQSKLYSTRSCAYLHLSTKELGKALKDAKQAIKIKPNSGKCFAQLAEVYEEQGKLTKSLKNFEKALAFNPIDKAITDARNAMRFKLAIKKTLENHRPYLLRNFKETVKEFTKSKGRSTAKILERYKKQLLNGSDPFSLVVQGHQFRDESNYAKAAELYQKASEQSNPEALLNLAMLTLHGSGVEKNFQEAIGLLLKASSQPAFKKANCPNYGFVQAGYFLGIYYEECTREIIKTLKAYGSSYENGCGLAGYRVGVLLYYGRVLPQNIDKALSFWKSVAKNDLFRNQTSNALAYASLVKHYITVESFKEACRWNMKAIDDGFTNILSENADEAREMLEELANCQMYIKFAELGLDDGLRPLRLGYSSEAIPQIPKLRRVQLDSMKREILEKYFSRKEEFCDRIDPIKTFALPKENDDCPYPVEKTERLKEMAKERNVVAQRLLDTQKHLLIAQEMLLSNENFDADLNTKIVSEFASACRLEHYHIRGEKEAMKKMISILKAEMENMPPETVSDFDRDLRICWIVQAYHGLNFDTVISFSKQSLKKYPNELLFYNFVGPAYVFKQDFETAAREINIGLQIFPNSSDLLYQKATSQFDLEYLSTETKISNYTKFFDHALHGDRALPQANYAVAILYDKMYRTEINQGTDGKEALRLSEEYFQKAKEAEQSTAADLPDIKLKLHAEEISANRALEKIFPQTN